MRYYPIHILLKDLSFWIPFFLIEKIIKHKDYLFQTEWWTAKEIVGTSIYMSIGFIIMNLIIFTLIFYLFKKNKVKPKSFLFGAGLHFISLALVWWNVELADRYLNFFVSTVISLVISGYVYKWLNSEPPFEEQTKKRLGII
jgi:hypothetical protein